MKSICMSHRNLSKHLCFALILIGSLLSFMLTPAIAQKDRMITGNITDALNNQAMPFVTVALKESLIGTISNENGGFDLLVPDSITNDVLLVTIIGYQPAEFPLTQITSPLVVKLQPVMMEMKEVIVKPQPPTYYIIQAMRSLKNNYPSQPFETQAYYRENINENDGFLRSAEGVFKTYYPGFQDSVKNQHQLILFRKAETLAELAFMKKEREKDAAKEKKKEAKAVKKGKEVKKKESDGDSLKIGEMFGGPETLLRMADLFRNADNCIDTTMLNEYNYTFEKSSSYNSRELMVINFKSKGKVERARESGKIYLDLASNAIVKIESQGTWIIPTLLRPVLFVMGIGVENPKFRSSLEFQKVKDHWYPRNMQFNMDLNVEKKRMFAANDNSNFKIFGILTVTRIDTASPQPVEKAKRYSSKKKPEEQVFNDAGLSWEQINVIKR